MSKFETLLKHERKLPYSFVSTILGLVGVIAAIYFSMYYEKKPQLDIEILSQFSALDIKESVDSLDVIYNKDSLNAKGQSLSVVELKVINNGDAPILRTYYDPQSQAGFTVKNGEVPENPIITGSKTPYKTEDIHLELVKTNSILLPHVIINSGDYYIIKLIVLHNSDLKPSIESFGVIAGFDRINVLTNLKSEDNRNFLQKFFEGTLLMNIGRFFFFGISFFLGIFLLIMTEEKLSDLRYSRNFKKSIEQFKKCNSQRIANVPNKFFNILQEKRKSTLELIFEDILNSKEDNFLYSKELKNLGVLNFTEIGRVVVDDNALSILIEFLHLLAEDGLIAKPKIQEKASLSVAA
ncbi:hypothetical protein BCT19_23560 [Vibrio splendidus]|uniref:hypothetical protein n=2 Tax=Vibrio splendidus TaxID=29497 RepID=UPI000C8307A1|nr:hypothetical protein [Vibrio splendidus]PMO00232.1 hypothetical protein BCT19_23560 [Vibrio splendidus]